MKPEIKPEDINRLMYYPGTYNDYRAAIHQLLEVIEKQHEALVFYTDEDNWNAKVYNDEGRTAQQALSQTAPYAKLRGESDES